MVHLKFYIGPGHRTSSPRSLPNGESFLASCRQPHAAGFSQLINHGIPNRSTTMPNRSAQKVSLIGIGTVPSSARALKTRSASAASLGLNMTQKLCGFLYSPGEASHPFEEPLPRDPRISSLGYSLHGY